MSLSTVICYITQTVYLCPVLFPLGTMSPTITNHGQPGLNLYLTMSRTPLQQIVAGRQGPISDGAKAKGYSSAVRELLHKSTLERNYKKKRLYENWSSGNCSSKNKLQMSKLQLFKLQLSKTCCFTN